MSRGVWITIFMSDAQQLPTSHFMLLMLFFANRELPTSRFCRKSGCPLAKRGEMLVKSVARLPDSSSSKGLSVNSCLPPSLRSSTGGQNDARPRNQDPKLSPQHFDSNYISVARKISHPITFTPSTELSVLANHFRSCPP